MLKNIPNGFFGYPISGWQEVQREAERERNLCRLVEVCLQNAPMKGNLRVSDCNRRQRIGGGRAHAPVEDYEALEHLQLVLIRYGAPDFVVQLLGEQHLRAQVLVGECAPALGRGRSMQ